MKHTSSSISFVFTDLDLPEFFSTKLPLMTRNQITLITGRQLLREYLGAGYAPDHLVGEDEIRHQLPRVMVLLRTVLQRAGYVSRAGKDPDFGEAVEKLVDDYRVFINKALRVGLRDYKSEVVAGWLPQAGSENWLQAVWLLAQSDRAVIEYNDPDEYLTLTLTIGYTPEERQIRLKNFRKPSLGEVLLDMMRSRFKKKPPRNF
jgi:hypothetical protein